ncbi:unnamed protein product [Ophioblennius macclurei]
MAAASSLLSEDRFLCSICLDTFTQPVSTPCGHNFCCECLHTYWDKSPICQCPFCKKTFASRPELHVNTTLSDLVAEFAKMVQVKASTSDPQLEEQGAILCDICSEIKHKAVKSCLVCLTSFCEAHLEPHHRVSVLKSHKLIDPIGNLDEKLCKQHCKLTELYCRTDRAFVCAMCFKTDHKSHDVVSLEEEYEAMIDKKDKVMADIQSRIQSRYEKIGQIKNELDASQVFAEKEKVTMVQMFEEFVRSIRRSQAELEEAIEERQRATKQKAEGFLKELETEINDLERWSSELEQLSQSEDHHCFLQNFSTRSLPSNKDWTDIGRLTKASFEPVRESFKQVRQQADEIMETIPEIKMKRMREHAVDVTFDPDTAHQSLIVSKDRKQVTVGTQQNLPNNPKRFEQYPEILGKEGLMSGKAYFEVQVKENTEWIVGVVRESINRKGAEGLSVSNGFWVFQLDEGTYKTYDRRAVTIKLEEKLEKIGVFVDYEKGVVSFYNAHSKLQIYSFTGKSFKEKLYPYFYNNGEPPAPLIITPVPQSNGT